MNKQKKAQIKKITAWVSLAALVALLSVMPLLAKNNVVPDGPQASIRSAKAENRSLDTLLLGGGVLNAQEAQEVTIPAQVKLTEYLVKNGDTVRAGDPIAKVDRVSIMTAVTQVQETLDLLKEEIEDAVDEENADTVKARTDGTVKMVYAQAGDDARSVMLEFGALAVLSLDDRMAVSLDTDTSLAGGDSVSVLLEDGTELSGRVETNLDGQLTVTVADEDYAVGEQVSVQTKEGTLLGSGELYIHAPWNAVAYDGSVKQVNIQPGDRVYAGKQLFQLENTGIAADHQVLVNRHGEYEKLMLELFQMYQTETIAAPCDGVVTGVDENGIFVLSSMESWQVTLLANAPTGDAEAAYINYVGQIWELGLDGMILRMNPQPFPVEDYLDLSGVNLDPALMTEQIVHTLSVPVFLHNGEEWVQLEPAALTPGDILLFAGDFNGTMVWAVKVGYSEFEKPEEPTEPSEPSEPTEPSEPAEPDQPTEPEVPSAPTEPATPDWDFQIPSGPIPDGITGVYDGYSSYLPEEDPYYDQTTVTVASVIPQGEVTIDFSVDERDILKVHSGETVEVTVSALEGEVFQGTITHMETEGENGGGSSKFTVTVTLTRRAGMLTGMNAAVKLPLERMENVLTLPAAALYDIGARTFVYTGYDAENAALINPIEVTTGRSDGEYVQIISGIDPDMEVWYEYYDTLVVSDIPESGFSIR